VSNLIAILEHLGHDVTFAYVPYETADYKAMERRLGRQLHILRSEGPPLHTLAGRAKRKILRALSLRSAHLWCVDDWFDNGLLSQVTRLQNAGDFDTVLIEYVFLSKLATVFPESVRTIIDTHDLMGDRHKIYQNSGMQPVWFATKPEEEIQALGTLAVLIASRFPTRVGPAFCLLDRPILSIFEDWSGSCSQHFPKSVQGYLVANWPLLVRQARGAHGPTEYWLWGR
jgi:hypothetical protein